MMDLKHTLLSISLAAAVAEQNTPTDQVRDLHQKLRHGLYRHRAELNQLGISDADIADIDNHGVIALGGTPKDPPPDSAAG